MLYSETIFFFLPYPSSNNNCNTIFWGWHFFLQLLELAYWVGPSVWFTLSHWKTEAESAPKCYFNFYSAMDEVTKNETVSEYKIPSSKPCRIGPMTENSSNYGTHLICLSQHLKTEAQPATKILCLVIIWQWVNSKKRRMFQNPGCLFSMTGSQNTNYTKNHKLGCYHSLEQWKIMLSLFYIFAYIT